MKIVRTLSIFFILVVVSCKQDRREYKASKKYIDSTLVHNSPVLVKDTLKKEDPFSFLDRYPVKKIPLVDSTNMDNFQNKKNLDKGQVRLLQLSKIVPSEIRNNIDGFSLNYTLQLSDNFKTLVVSYLPSENELYTTLVNYDKNYKIIDWEVVAYDEIAEGWFRIMSNIDKQKIQVKDISYVESNPGIEITNHSITKEGNIVEDKLK